MPSATTSQSPANPKLAPDDFDFDLGHPRRIITDKKLLAGLRAYAATVGNTPFRFQDFNRWPDRPFCAHSAIRRFGSWNAALKRIGLGPAPRMGVDAATLIDALERVWRQTGRPPGDVALRQHSGFSPKPYMRIWGGVRRACQALARYHKGRITRQQLLAGDAERQRRIRARRIPIDLRWTVLKRDRHRCRLCGRSPATARIELHVDHIRPLSRGGTNALSNLRTLCADCNSGRGDGRRAEGLRPRKCAGRGDARANRGAPRRVRR